MSTKCMREPLFAVFIFVDVDDLLSFLAGVAFGDEFDSSERDPAAGGHQGCLQASCCSPADWLWFLGTAVGSMQTWLC